MQENCPLCQKVNLCRENNFPWLIQEFTDAYWILGDHQFYPGYSQIILKEHARELHELSSKVQKELFENVMQAGRAVAHAFNPLKMNYASYGNIVEHIHWHIIPRYENDPDKYQDPFKNASKFPHFPTQTAIAIRNIELIRAHMR